MRTRVFAIVGLGVIGAALLLSNIGGETGKQESLTVEQWQRRVAERIDWLVAENVVLRQRCARLEGRMDVYEMAHNAVVDENMGTRRMLVTSLKEITAWGTQVGIALQRASTPIIVKPPDITVFNNDPNTGWIVNELRNIGWELRNGN